MYIGMDMAWKEGVSHLSVTLKFSLILVTNNCTMKGCICTLFRTQPYEFKLASSTKLYSWREIGKC